MSKNVSTQTVCPAPYSFVSFYPAFPEPNLKTTLFVDVKHTQKSACIANKQPTQATVWITHGTVTKTNKRHLTRLQLFFEFSIKYVFFGVWLLCSTLCFNNPPSCLLLHFSYLHGHPVIYFSIPLLSEDTWVVSWFGYFHQCCSVHSNIWLSVDVCTHLIGVYI